MGGRGNEESFSDYSVLYDSASYVSFEIVKVNMG